MIFSKLDKLEDIKMNYLEKIKCDMNQEFAKRVAKNLYNYLDSFNEVCLFFNFYFFSIYRTKILVKKS